MAGFKTQRFSENLRRELSFLIRNLKNLKDSAQNFSVSRVEVLGGGTRVKVFISSIKGLVDAKFATKHLLNASGFIKRELSNKLRLKKSPEIEFVACDFAGYGAYLNRVFEQLKSDSDSKNNNV